MFYISSGWLVHETLLGLILQYVSFRMCCNTRDQLPKNRVFAWTQDALYSCPKKCIVPSKYIESPRSNLICMHVLCCPNILLNSKRVQSIYLHHFSNNHHKPSRFLSMHAWPCRGFQCQYGDETYFVPCEGAWSGGYSVQMHMLSNLVPFKRNMSALKMII